MITLYTGHDFCVLHGTQTRSSISTPSTFCNNLFFNQWSYHRYHRQQCFLIRIVSADGCRHRCYDDSGFSGSSVVKEILPYSGVGISLLPYDKKARSLCLFLFYQPGSNPRNILLYAYMFGKHWNNDSSTYDPRRRFPCEDYYRLQFPHLIQHLIFLSSH